MNSIDQEQMPGHVSPRCHRRHRRCRWQALAPPFSQLPPSLPSTFATKPVATVSVNAAAASQRLNLNLFLNNFASHACVYHVGAVCVLDVCELCELTPRVRAPQLAFFTRGVSSGCPARSSAVAKKNQTLPVECAGQGVSQVAIKGCFDITNH